MTLLDLLRSPHTFINELTRLHATYTKPHQRKKIIYGNLIAEDLFLHKKQYAATIAASIKQQDYFYQPLRKSIIKQQDKLRGIYPHFITDYLIQRVIAHYYMQKLDSSFSESLFSYRKGCSSQQAKHKLINYIKQHTCCDGQLKKIDLYIIQTDLQNYTDTIPITNQQILWKILEPLKEDDYTWELIQKAIRAVYIENDSSYCKLFGIAMGSPLTPLIANLYLNNLDHQLASDSGCLYLRYGDDMLFASPNAKTVQQASHTINQYMQTHGLTINSEKANLIYLTRSGSPSKIDSFKGKSTLHYLGSNIHADGSLSLKPKKETLLIRDLKQRIHRSGRFIDNLPVEQKGKLICQMLNNIILDNGTLTHPNFSSYLRSIDNRNMLKRMDYYIALEVAKYLTHSKSIKAFRQIPYQMIRNQFGLLSLCHVKNKMGHYGKH